MYRLSIAFIFLSLIKSGIIFEIGVSRKSIDRRKLTELCRMDKNRFRVNWGENIDIQSHVEKSLSVETFRFERYTVFVAPIKIDLLHVRFANQLPFPPPINL